MNLKTPIWFRINTINLFISSILYHTAIEFNNKYSNIIYYYDRFAISLVCSYRIFNNQILALFISIISIFNEKFKNCIYIFSFIILICKISYKRIIHLFILQIFSFHFYYKHLQRKNLNWNIIEKVIWHVTQSFYIYIGSFSFI